MWSKEQEMWKRNINPYEEKKENLEWYVYATWVFCAVMFLILCWPGYAVFMSLLSLNK